MKIFVWGNNYSLGNKRQLSPFSNQAPFFYTKPDSALLKDGKPFFLPDFLTEVSASVEFVVRIGRLGKSIPARFAYRYYEEATVGVNLFAKGGIERLSSEGLPWDEAVGFDGSAVVGTFVPAKPEEERSWGMELKINGQSVQAGCMDAMTMGINEEISFLSRYYTLKTGDLVYTGAVGVPAILQIGDHLEGYLNRDKLLDFYIR